MHKRTIIIFDEFQDLLEVPEALALLRSKIQKLKTTPILFLGSKRSLLSQIFATNNSPFFDFADEYILQPIAVSDWKPYFAERLKPTKCHIADTALDKLCTEMLHVPNSICEVGAFIQDNYTNTEIDENLLLKILSEILTKKADTYRYQLSTFTAIEFKFMKTLAMQPFTKSIMSKGFLLNAQIGASSSAKVLNKLIKLGIVEEENLGYRLSNPLLSLFLKYRSF